MNLLNRFKTKRILLILCYILTSNTRLYAQYFKSVEKNLVGCWKVEGTETNDYYLILKDNVAFIKTDFGNERSTWQIGRDSLTNKQLSHKNIGGYVLNIDDDYFAVLSVSQKRIVLMDLEKGAIVLSLKKRRCKYCRKR